MPSHLDICFILCIWVFTSMFLCAPHVYSAPGGQKRASEPLEPEPRRCWELHPGLLLEQQVLYPSSHLPATQDTFSEYKTVCQGKVSLLPSAQGTCHVEKDLGSPHPQRGRPERTQPYADTQGMHMKVLPPTSYVPSTFQAVPRTRKALPKQL